MYIWTNAPCRKNRRGVVHLGLIIIIRVIGHPVRHDLILMPAIRIVDLLMCHAIGIWLVGMIVGVWPIRLVVGIVLIRPVIQLLFGMRFPWYFTAHLFLLSEPKNPRTCIVRGRRLQIYCFTRNKTRPMKYYRFVMWCKATKQQGDNYSQPAQPLSWFLNENCVGINSFNDLLICLSNAQILPDLIRTLILRIVDA